MSDSRMMVWKKTSMKRVRTDRPLRLLFRRQKSTSDLNAKNYNTATKFSTRAGRGRGGGAGEGGSVTVKWDGKTARAGAFTREREREEREGERERRKERGGGEREEEEEEEERERERERGGSTKTATRTCLGPNSSHRETNPPHTHVYFSVNGHASPSPSTVKK